MGETGAETGVQQVRVSDASEGQRLDNFLLARLRGVPKSRVYRMIRSGEVRVNKGRAKPMQRLQDGDLVRIPPVRQAQSAEAVRPSADLAGSLQAATVYEDDALLVIDKPSGLAVHGGSGVRLGLVEALRAMRPEARFLELVHRLDRDTSGLVMLAKKRSMLLQLHEMLRSGSLHKRYCCLVWGRWPAQRTQVDQSLLKQVLQSGERLVKVSDQGKAARTDYQLLEQYRFEGMPLSLLAAMPVTGRTHQIRVHCRAAGCPIAGDPKYGDPERDARLKAVGLRRLFLHANELDIPMTDGTTLCLRADLPQELQRVLEALR